MILFLKITHLGEGVFSLDQVNCVENTFCRKSSKESHQRLLVLIQISDNPPGK